MKSLIDLPLIFGDTTNPIVPGPQCAQTLIGMIPFNGLIPRVFVVCSYIALTIASLPPKSTEVKSNSEVECVSFREFIFSKKAFFVVLVIESLTSSPSFNKITGFKPIVFPIAAKAGEIRPPFFKAVKLLGIK